MSEAVKTPAYMAVDEFLAWNPGGSETRRLVNGMPHAAAPASTAHAKISSWLAQAIENHLDALDSPCSALVEPGVMPHLNASHNLRVPTWLPLAPHLGTSRRS